MRIFLQMMLFPALCLAFTANGAERNDAQTTVSDDPPDRVARVSYIKGRIDLQTRDDSDWTSAAINQPLTSGGRMRLDSNARAELQVGAINIQLDEHSDFAFLELTDGVAQAQLVDGAMFVQIRRLRNDEIIEIDTPHAAVALVKPGQYSIAIIDGGTHTRVRALEGEAEITDHGRTVKLGSRQQAMVAAGDPPLIESLTARNSFESWARDRNQRLERSASARYVDPDVIGYADLDDHGEWVHEAEYGHVWYPRVVVSDWAPYRHGRWVWVSPWGWTWVDEAPWGFAPFHYGRWAHVRGRWCWVPGPLHVRPVYAPALVAWVGIAPPRTRVSVTVAFGGGIGWFPLAPREVYVPSYHCSRRHIHSVNYANTVIVNNIYINRAYTNRSVHFDYRNRAIRDAVTVSTVDALRSSRPVREHRVHVDHRDLRSWKTHNAISDFRPEPRVRREQVNDSRRDSSRERSVVMRNTPRVQSMDQRGESHGRQGIEQSSAAQRSRAVERSNRDAVERPAPMERAARERGYRVEREASDGRAQQTDRVQREPHRQRVEAAPRERPDASSREPRIERPPRVERNFERGIERDVPERGHSRPQEFHREERAGPRMQAPPSPRGAGQPEHQRVERHNRGGERRILER